jgi:hypothetical protein
VARLAQLTAAMTKPYKNSTSSGVLRLTEDFFYPIAKEADYKWAEPKNEKES